ncbi:MAG: hypothetical protein H0W90_02210 [Actinobacteria bacterium]|nr:hypothetical protein [Actinomycetota bacterium]
MSYTQKLARAKEHFATLEADLGRYIFDDKTYSVRPTQSSDRKKHSFFGTLHEEPPAEWGPLVGDTLHNLRCTLDHIVWELADPAMRGKHTMFPMFTCRDDFSRLVKKGAKKGQPAHGGGLYRLSGVAADPLAIIEAAQPYNWAGDSEHPGEALRILDKIENIDKHRTLHTVGAFTAPEKSDIPIPDGETLSVTLFGGPLAVGKETEVLTLDFSFDPSGMKMEVDLSFTVLFTDTGVVDGTPIDATLSGLISQVEAVTDDLKPYLP